MSILHLVNFNPGFYIYKEMKMQERIRDEQIAQRDKDLKEQAAQRERDRLFEQEVREKDIERERMHKRWDRGWALFVGLIVSFVSFGVGYYFRGPTVRPTVVNNIPEQKAPVVNIIIPEKKADIPQR